jgi:hypothetical protein
MMLSLDRILSWDLAELFSFAAAYGLYLTASTCIFCFSVFPFIHVSLVLHSSSLFRRLPSSNALSVSGWILISPLSNVQFVKRSALKDITNIAKHRSSALGECIEDVQCLVYRSAEEFLPTIVSTPPTFNTP